MTQYLVVHSWPDGSYSIMPEINTSLVAAEIYRDHCNAIQHPDKGNGYVVAIVPYGMVVTMSTPRKRIDDKPRVLTDEQVSELARA